MIRRALLIAPYIHDFSAYDLWLKPLGLLYVAAAAEAAGYEASVINCLDRLHPAATAIRGPNRARTEPGGKGKFSYETIARPECLKQVPRKFKRYGIPIEAFRHELSSGTRPDAIGITSMMTYWYGGVAETVAIVREVFPETPIVLGGVYATLCPEHAREHVGADAVLTGPGEKAFVEFLRHEVGGSNGSQTRPDNLRPAYHLLRNLDSVSMLTSYGCPYSCAYCASRLLRRTFVQRPVGEVVDEIAYYVEQLRTDDIAFYDDALLANPEAHIKPILREVIRRGLNVRFHAPNGLHANMIDCELALLMRAAGFATVRLSLESVTREFLTDSCDKVTLEGFKGAVANLSSAGYPPGAIEAYVMMGVPGQRLGDVEQAMHFAHKVGALVRLADFSPIPGTKCFDTAVQTYDLNPGEPLLQNSSVLPHLVPGMWGEHQRLKMRARELNSRLIRRETAPMS